MPRKVKKTTTTVVEEFVEPDTNTMSEKTVVTFLLDRTGSMSMIQNETIKAFNGYLDELAASDDLIEFTLLQFDSASTDMLCNRLRPSQVMRLNKENYVPRALTPLWDACFHAIKVTDEALQGRQDKPKAIVVIQTDGQENCSKFHPLWAVKQMIADREERGWKFVFLGANINAYEQATKLGIDRGSTVSYSGALSTSSFIGLAQNTRSYATGASASMNFNASQKLASGDAYDPVVEQLRQGLTQFTPAAAPTLQPKPHRKRAGKRPHLG